MPLRRVIGDAVDALKTPSPSQRRSSRTWLNRAGWLRRVRFPTSNRFPARYSARTRLLR